MMGKLISKLIIGVCVLLGIYGLFVIGYFLWAANQPLQVAEAQAIAPGMTFKELIADRYARWKERDEQLFSSGQAKTEYVCRGSSGSIFYPAVFSANISVTIGHFKPEQEAFFREAWNGVYPPTEVLIGPLHKAWWWEVEHYAWYLWVNPAGGQSSVAMGCHVGYPTRPVDAQ